MRTFEGYALQIWSPGLVKGSWDFVETFRALSACILNPYIVALAGLVKDEIFGTTLHWSFPPSMLRVIQ